jgi:hypothetical protein
MRSGASGAEHVRHALHAHKNSSNSASMQTASMPIAILKVFYSLTATKGQIL